MKHLVYSTFLIALLIMGCSETKTVQSENPFFTQWDTPFGAPPFEKIKPEHYMPAFIQGMKEHKEDIDKIVDNSEAPTFENTLVAMDKSGALLNKVSMVFENLTDAHTNDSLQAISKEISPLLSAHYDDINLNQKLFERVKTVYKQKDSLELSPEQQMLLTEVYKGFVRGGADLPDDKKARMREINKELSGLSIQFSENVLKDNNAFKLVIDNKDDLVGLPASAIAGAAATAKEDGLAGNWVFTISRPSLYPFLTSSPMRELREHLYKGYINKGDNNNEFDNKEIVARIATLRIERAQLFGFNSHAEYVLDENMAKSPDKVYDILLKVWKEAVPVAEQEVKDMQAIINKEGGNFTLQPWDWWYYAEKVRLERYALSEEELSAYFEVNNVRDGVFAVATKLFGITFTPRPDVPVYQKDVKPFEVKEADGTSIGILYTDYFARPSKRGGAWMSAYRKQEVIDGENILPIIVNVCNFPAPTEDSPSLLSLDQVTTMFHEFGHGLHGLLSKCESHTLSGTSVARDFVELPSQIMENWAFEPEVMAMYAKNYKTGEIMPAELIQKINNAA